MAMQAERAMTVAEYLEWEERQELRHEYIDGVIIKVTDDTLVDSDITINRNMTVNRILATG
ncbi:MAG: hypothetical protein OXG85_09855 [Chloroflexi bacterium]|nr:hypothetical protein [Chloroflexota bacterium]